MTLFTAEVLLKAQVRAAMAENADTPPVVSGTNGRWLVTQDGGLKSLVPVNLDGWLVARPELRETQAPGYTT